MIGIHFRSANLYWKRAGFYSSQDIRGRNGGARFDYARTGGASISDRTQLFFLEESVCILYAPIDMALGPNSGRASRNTPALSSEERTRGKVAICNAENSALAVETFRRDSRPNVRPYKRTSTQKLKWTYELHQCFKRAVEKLGGQVSK